MIFLSKGAIILSFAICLVFCSHNTFASQNASSVVYVRLLTGHSYENYCGYIDPRNAPFVLLNRFNATLTHPVKDKTFSNGCDFNDTKVFGGDVKDHILFLSRGRCTFGIKASNAAKAGASGVVFVSNSRYSASISVQTSVKLPAGFVSVIISKVAYSSIVSHMATSSVTKLGLYQPMGDVKEGNKLWVLVVLYILAIVSITGGAIFSGYARRDYLLKCVARAAAGGSPSDSTVPLQMEKPWEVFLFILIMVSIPVCILLALIFIYDYVIWVLLCFYFIIILLTVNHYLAKVFLYFVNGNGQEERRMSFLSKIRILNCGKCGNTEYHYFELVVFPVSLTIAIVWAVYRNAHWAFILTDILNVLICMKLLEKMWLGMKFITVLLALLLVYDVFFVFITPLFPGGSNGSGGGSNNSDVPLQRHKRDTLVDYYLERKDSYMGKVATGTAGLSGEIFPVSFRLVPYPIPESISTCMYPFSLLGLGDIIVPGLLLSYNFFYDLCWQRRYYPHFIISLFGYCLGLAITAVVLVVQRQGQPALLYIIPCALGLSYLLALIRRDIKGYFTCKLPDNYTPSTPPSESNNPVPTEGASCQTFDQFEQDNTDDSQPLSPSKSSTGGIQNGDGHRYT